MGHHASVIISSLEATKWIGESQFVAHERQLLKLSKAIEEG